VFHTVSYASFASLPARTRRASPIPVPGARLVAAGAAEQSRGLVHPLSTYSYRSFGHFAIGLEWALVPLRDLARGRRQGGARGPRSGESVSTYGGVEKREQPLPCDALRRRLPRPRRKSALERYVAKRPQRAEGFPAVLGGYTPAGPSGSLPREAPQCGLLSPVGREGVFSLVSVLSHRFRTGRGVDCESRGAGSPIRAARKRGRRAWS
jgi:hypothetical protein